MTLYGKRAFSQNFMVTVKFSRFLKYIFQNMFEWCCDHDLTMTQKTLRFSNERDGMMESLRSIRVHSLI